MSIAPHMLTNTALARAGWLLCQFGQQCGTCGQDTQAGDLFYARQHNDPHEPSCYRCRACASGDVSRTRAAAMSIVAGLNPEQRAMLDAIRGRHGNTTPGPWKWFAGPRDLYLGNERHGRMVVMDCGQETGQGAMIRFRDFSRGYLMKAVSWLRNGKIEHPDAVFIEHAWGDVDQLLAMVDALRAQIGERA